MKKLLTLLFVEDKYHAGTILGTILGLMVVIALIVPTKTKWIIALILTILENIFNR